MSMFTIGRNKWLWCWLIFYLVGLVVFAVFSFSLTAPNLILSNWEPYWRFQTWMWQTFFNQRQLLTRVYIGIITGLFVGYLGLIRQLRQVQLQNKPGWILALVLAMPLMLASTALSYDVFNYIFNAKMVLIYQANPHVQVALDFVRDDWTRFMHNTHTPAPYGYGWTALSLLPFTLGGLRFTLTWWLFRLFSLISLGWIALIWYRTKLADKWWLMALLINPLVLIEVIGNSHNDLWMMAPAVWSMLIVSRWTARWSVKSIAQLLGSVALLAFSISIKLATVTLIPVWVVLVGAAIFQTRQRWANVINHWPLVASVASFIPLLTLRSQQFHPWYLLWPLVWVPLIKWRPWKWGLVVLSISSLARYVPYLWSGEYTAQTLSQQKLITWIPWLIFWALFALKWLWQKIRPSLH